MGSMRFVIYGAGGIGGTIGARLFQQGEAVALIARGAHLAALREHGLRLVAPDGEHRSPSQRTATPPNSTGAKATSCCCA